MTFLAFYICHNIISPANSGGSSIKVPLRIGGLGGLILIRVKKSNQLLKDLRPYP